MKIKDEAYPDDASQRNSLASEAISCGPNETIFRRETSMCKQTAGSGLVGTIFRDYMSSLSVSVGAGLTCMTVVYALSCLRWEADEGRKEEVYNGLAFTTLIAVMCIFGVSGFVGVEFISTFGPKRFHGTRFLAIVIFWIIVPTVVLFGMWFVNFEYWWYYLDVIIVVVEYVFLCFFLGFLGHTGVHGADNSLRSKIRSGVFFTIVEAWTAALAIGYSMLLVPFYLMIGDTWKIVWRLLIHPLYFEVLMGIPVRFLVAFEMREFDVVKVLAVVHMHSHVTIIGRFMMTSFDSSANALCTIVFVNVFKLLSRISLGWRDVYYRKLYAKFRKTFLPDTIKYSACARKHRRNISYLAAPRSPSASYGDTHPHDQDDQLPPEHDAAVVPDLVIASPLAISCTAASKAHGEQDVTAARSMSRTDLCTTLRGKDASSDMAQRHAHPTPYRPSGSFCQRRRPNATLQRSASANLNPASLGVPPRSAELPRDSAAGKLGAVSPTAGSVLTTPRAVLRGSRKSFSIEDRNYNVRWGAHTVITHHHPAHSTSASHVAVADHDSVRRGVQDARGSNKVMRAEPAEGHEWLRSKAGDGDALPCVRARSLRDALNEPRLKSWRDRQRCDAVTECPRVQAALPVVPTGVWAGPPALSSGSRLLNRAASGTNQWAAELMDLFSSEPPHSCAATTHVLPGPAPHEHASVDEFRPSESGSELDAKEGGGLGCVQEGAPNAVHVDDAALYVTSVDEAAGMHLVDVAEQMRDEAATLAWAAADSGRWDDVRLRQLDESDATVLMEDQRSQASSVNSSTVSLLNEGRYKSWFIQAVNIYTEMTLDNTAIMVSAFTAWCFADHRDFFFLPLPKHQPPPSDVFWIVGMQYIVGMVFDYVALLLAALHVGLPMPFVWREMKRKKLPFFGFLVYGTLFMGVVGALWMAVMMPRPVMCPTKWLCDCAGITDHLRDVCSAFKSPHST